jgi:uncharacterized repeat protein (TIGR03806 family)
MKKAVLLAVFASLLACSGSSPARPESEAGPKKRDAGSARGHGMDAGAKDAASFDAGLTDAGDGYVAAADAGAHDAGTVDASAVDAGAPDAGGGPPDAGPGDSGQPDAGPHAHGLAARIENTTCFLRGAPPLDVVAVANTPAFAALGAQGPVALVRNGGRLALLESSGKIRGFAANGDGSDAALILDLGTKIRAGGLRGAAFRPDGGALLVSYVPVDDPLRIVVTRYALANDGSANPASEQPLLTLPVTDATRAGGALAFLFDGTLIAAFGDGGTSAAATGLSSLAGKVVRIDVSGANGYTVPADNPFVADANALHETYALGLGAPTSCMVDRVTGHAWCADAGDASNDHFVLVSAGATLRAILSFARIGCGAVVGFVSRDARLPDIQGALVFGDKCSTTLRAMRFDGSLVRSQADVTTLPAAPAALGEDADGRGLIVDSAGAAHALVRPATPLPAFPPSLSATGCIADMSTRTPAASLIPFEVRTPLWSDGAKKHRFIILPGNQSIGFTMEGAWQFPVGTMFMKEFLLDDDNDAATPERIMETRFLIKRSDTAWEGYSYMWDRERKDAFLLDGSEIEGYPMQPGALDSSGASIHRHTFPDRTQCLLCHNAAAGRALGLQTGRMNTDHDYDGFVENQLKAMDYVSLFSAPLPAAPDALPRFAQPADDTASLESRARSFLYANCSHCHQPGGTTPVALDFRYETSFADTKTCGVTPRYAIAQIPGAKIITPGSAAQSELFFRLSHRDANQMPPIATLIVDPVGVDVVQRWIDSLTTCP